MCRQKSKQNKINMNPEIIIPITVFASIFGIAYVYLMTRNKERMALIEKDQSAELFNKENKVGHWGLKIGIMSVGISLGILLGNAIAGAGIVEEQVAFPSMIFMCGGAGLIVSHYISKKQ